MITTYAILALPMKLSTTHQKENYMKELLSVITRKGQVTVPAEVRRAMGLKQGDKVAFRLEDGVARIAPASSPVDESFQVAPPLSPPRTLREIDEIVQEEIAQNAAQEGLGK
jgi:AbrB family looped-hinge helix DNA binding protein